jgi:adenine-specific DNA-methyltransferase
MALQKDRDITPKGAGKIAVALLYLWQVHSFPKLDPVSMHGMKKYAADPEVQRLAKWILDRPFLEAAFWLSSAYALLVGRDHQSKYAMYFTPPMLADRLIDNLLASGASLRTHIWKDPACGGGAFLTPVAVRMVAQLTQDKVRSDRIVRTVARNLVGNDLDPILATLSKNFIAMALYEHICRAKFVPKLNIFVADSLKPVPVGEAAADVVICNPPYRKMTRAEVDVYRENFADVIEGQPNLYGLFIRRCLAMAGPNSLIGLLTPTSYLSGQNFSKLRKTLVRLSDVRQLDLVRQKEGVFLRVEQETALSIFQSRDGKSQEKRAATVFILEGNEFKDVGTFSAPTDGCAWPIPRDAGDAIILQRAGKGPFRLSDYGYAARTGAYVFYRDKRKTFAKKPKEKVNRAIFPLIWSSDITTDGSLIHGRANNQEKRDIYIDMADIKHASVVTRPCVALQRITSADQGRRLIGAAVPTELLEGAGGVVGENHVLFLEQISVTSAITPHQLASILGSTIVDRLFRCISGAVNVSIFELNQLPLPSPEVIARYLAAGEHTIDEAVQLTFDDFQVREQKLWI